MGLFFIRRGLCGGAGCFFMLYSMFSILFSPVLQTGFAMGTGEAYRVFLRICN